jgi:hypothetical protein
MEAAKEIKLYPIGTKPKDNRGTGFIALYRSIRNHWLWKSSHKKTKFEAWIDLILLANHDPYKEPVGYDLIELKKGQVLTSQEKLAKEWFWDRSAIRNFLNQLQRDRMISLKVTTKYTVITICNYSLYNDIRPRKQQRDNNETTSTQHIQPLEPLEPLLDSANAQQKIGFKKWDDKMFIDEIGRFKDRYERDMLNAFYKHWGEKDDKGKMLFQYKQTWETGKRLATWFTNSKKFNK